MTDQILPLWIDAIAINQDDICERNRQVQRMGEIYDTAVSVYSYVGQPAEDDVAVFEFVEKLWKYPVVPMNDCGEFNFGERNHTGGGFEYSENTIKPDRLAQQCAALYRFLSRQYFRRGWVLQVS
jgi:hypothetical protein